MNIITTSNYSLNDISKDNFFSIIDTLDIHELYFSLTTLKQFFIKSFIKSQDHLNEFIKIFIKENNNSFQRIILILDSINDLYHYHFKIDIDIFKYSLDYKDEEYGNIFYECYSTISNRLSIILQDSTIDHHQFFNLFFKNLFNKDFEENLTYGDHINIHRINENTTVSYGLIDSLTEYIEKEYIIYCEHDQRPLKDIISPFIINQLELLINNKEFHSNKIKELKLFFTKHIKYIGTRFDSLWSFISISETFEECLLDIMVNPKIIMKELNPPSSYPTLFLKNPTKLEPTRSGYIRMFLYEKIMDKSSFELIFLPINSRNASDFTSDDLYGYHIWISKHLNYLVPHLDVYLPQVFDYLKEDYRDKNYYYSNDLIYNNIIYILSKSTTPISKSTIQKIYLQLLDLYKRNEALSYHHSLFEKVVQFNFKTITNEQDKQEFLNSIEKFSTINNRISHYIKFYSLSKDQFKNENYSLLLEMISYCDQQEDPIDFNIQFQEIVTELFPGIEIEDDLIKYFKKASEYILVGSLTQVGLKMGSRKDLSHIRFKLIRFLFEDYDIPIFAGIIYWFILTQRHTIIDDTILKEGLINLFNKNGQEFLCQIFNSHYHFHRLEELALFNVQDFITEPLWEQYNTLKFEFDLEYTRFFIKLLNQLFLESPIFQNQIYEFNFIYLINEFDLQFINQFNNNQLNNFIIHNLNNNRLPYSLLFEIIKQNQFKITQLLNNHNNNINDNNNNFYNLLPNSYKTQLNFDIETFRLNQLQPLFKIIDRNNNSSRNIIDYILNDLIILNIFKYLLNNNNNNNPEMMISLKSLSNYSLISKRFFKLILKFISSPNSPTILINSKIQPNSIVRNGVSNVAIELEYYQEIQQLDYSKVSNFQMIDEKYRSNDPSGFDSYHIRILKLLNQLNSMTLLFSTLDKIKNHLHLLVNNSQPKKITILLIYSIDIIRFNNELIEIIQRNKDKLWLKLEAYRINKGSFLNIGLLNEIVTHSPFFILNQIPKVRNLEYLTIKPFYRDSNSKSQYESNESINIIEHGPIFTIPTLTKITYDGHNIYHITKIIESSKDGISNSTSINEISFNIPQKSNFNIFYKVEEEEIKNYLEDMFRSLQIIFNVLSTSNSIQTVRMNILHNHINLIEVFPNLNLHQFKYQFNNKTFKSFPL